MSQKLSLRRKLFLSVILILISRLLGMGWETSPSLQATPLQSTRADLVPLQNIKQISAGNSHTCVLTIEGNVLCWGQNFWGQLGDGTDVSKNAPVPVNGLGSVTAISAGGDHTCAVTTMGGVACWGMNDNGELGDGTTVDKNLPVTVSGLDSGAAAISASDNHTCALTITGGVLCWGYNITGQLGDGTTIGKNRPVAVNGLDSGVAAISTGSNHTCALTTTDGVLCWGYNGDGQLGDGTDLFRNTPVAVSGLNTGVETISAGYDHTCALTVVGKALCWGANGGGQLGNGTYISKNTPVAVSGLSDGMTTISAGYYHTCVLTSVGDTLCWGLNSYGELGDGTTVRKNTPVTVGGLSDSMSAIGAGGEHTCALTTTGSVFCWGRNDFGQLGNDTTANKNTPVTVSGLDSGIATISAGNRHTCAVTTTGAALCWGLNFWGQLGDDTTIARNTPIPVSGLSSSVAAVSAGGEHTCAVTTAGAALCWGLNDTGQLGNSATGFFTYTPVAVSGLGSGVTAISAGEYHTCALTTAGAVRCWGLNVDGQLGDGTTVSKGSPVAVSGLSSGVVAISAGSAHTCALTTTGAVRCWGNNTDGQLGDGTLVNKNKPVAVSGLSSGTAVISTGRHHTCALTSAGGSFCWGNNDYGQLGDNTNVSKSTPVAVSGLNSGMTAISASDFLHTCALTAAGVVLCWGLNSYGQLGDNTTTTKNMPVAVNGLDSGVSAVSTGSLHTCAVTITGSGLCWGSNENGQLGDGSAWRTVPGAVLVAPTPTDIPTSTPTSTGMPTTTGTMAPTTTSTPASTLTSTGTPTPTGTPKPIEVKDSEIFLPVVGR